MLITIEQFRTSRIIDEFLSSYRQSKMKYYASDVLAEIGCENQDDVENCIHRAIDVCETMQIPVGDHFKIVYRSRNQRLEMDWKLSSLAYYLVMINGNPKNPFVARLQLELVGRLRRSK